MCLSHCAVCHLCVSSQNHKCPSHTGSADIGANQKPVKFLWQAFDGKHLIEQRMMVERGIHSDSNSPVVKEIFAHQGKREGNCYPLNDQMLYDALLQVGIRQYSP